MARILQDDKILVLYAKAARPLERMVGLVIVDTLI